MMFNSRLVHIDLKGAPLKLNYFEALLPFLSNIGINGLLIEYEDMFPYNDYLTAINCDEVYSIQQIERFIQLANINNLKIIPLIQTFGHLEFVLKHELFRELREMDSYPNSICPSNEKSLELVKDMIKQMVSLHQKFTKLDAIHIGCDEVWHLAYCQNCKQSFHNNQWSHKSQLFLDFVSKIANFIKNSFSIDVIIWDDMIRGTDIQFIIESKLNNLVQPMVWHYLDINSFQLTDEQFWLKYKQLFNNIWIATAFKGASKMNQLLPPINYHISNHMAWTQVIDKYKLSNIKGVALTGWQRFDHLTTLCELFPNSIISLLMCLFALNERTFNQTVHEKASHFMNYRGLLPIDDNINDNDIDSINCDLFPGALLFKLCSKWKILVQEFNSLKSNPSLDGAFTKYQLIKNRTNPLHIESFLLRARILLFRGNDLKLNLEIEMKNIFYDSTIEEWISLHINPVLKKLEKIVGNGDQQLLLHLKPDQNPHIYV